MTRFAGISLGGDVKGNQKRIKLTPGPADYETVPSNANSVVKQTHNWSLNHGGVQVKDSVGEAKQKIQSRLLNVDKAMSTNANRTPIPSMNIIQQNKLAVRDAGLHQLMNSTGPSFAEKLKNHDTTSESMGLSMTNFSKNRDPTESINFQEANFVVKNKKARKGKLPSLMDDSKVTPR